MSTNINKKTKYDRIGELAQIIETISIENIVRTRIKEVGSNKYICPFHDDHTPNNFKIRKKYNKFQCFACGTFGDGIRFIQYYDGISWKEAVIKIALENGLITIEESINLLEVNENSQEIYKNNNLNTDNKKVFINNKEDTAATITELSSIDIIHKIYSIFIKGYSILGKEKLSEQHKNEIKEARNLSDEEIEKDGYFTFPNIDFNEYFLEELKKENISLDLLKGVPGFYYSKSKEHWAFTVLRDTSGIGIPIKNIDGKIVGIQIRLDKVSEKKKRYQWFSSAFAGGDGSKGAKNIYGTSSGAPVAVVYPDKLKNGTIFITEGFFKARTTSKQYNCISLSVQGVHNWKEIPLIIQQLQEKNKHHKNICIAFDGDMGRKDTVLKPALQLGLVLTNIDFGEKLNKDIETILKTGNRPLSSKAGNYKESAKEISELIENTKIDKNIYFCLWNEDLGKGIDDLINGNAIETMRSLLITYFWNYSFNMLCELDDLREQKSKEENIDFKKVIISEEEKKKLYMKHIDEKLKK